MDIATGLVYPRDLTAAILPKVHGRLSPNMNKYQQVGQLRIQARPEHDPHKR